MATEELEDDGGHVPLGYDESGFIIASANTDLWPPKLDIPRPPVLIPQFDPRNFRGYHPKNEYYVHLEGAILELQRSNTYTEVLGSSVPTLGRFTDRLSKAYAWSKMRRAVEKLLNYVKYCEAVSWKTALTDLERVNSVYQAVVAQDATLFESMPALRRLLDVPYDISKRSAATRLRKAKAKRAAILEGKPPTE